MRTFVRIRHRVFRSPCPGAEGSSIEIPALNLCSQSLKNAASARFRTSDSRLLSVKVQPVHRIVEGHDVPTPSRESG